MSPTVSRVFTAKFLLFLNLEFFQIYKIHPVSFDQSMSFHSLKPRSVGGLQKAIANQVGASLVNGANSNTLIISEL